ncbi:MAG TPA: hypothetical protein ENN29_01060, partial [Candidatus Hydrogenedentes bacterium]|nr:hypothetical protein [Candidatus Hydrogenedentota bacterium]
LKKKRLFYLACILALGWVGLTYGFDYALGCVAAFFILLGTRQLWKLFISGKDFDVLRSLQPRYAWEAQIERLPKRESAEETWNFVVLGDTRNNVAVSRQLYRRAKEESPDMLFHTGDIVRSGTASELLNNHVRVLEEEDIDFPVFCVPGNHERGPLYTFSAYNTLYGGDRFSFAHGQCNFIGFNNSGKRGIGDEELGFLETELTKPARFSFVFLHIPPAFFEAAFVMDSHRRGFKKNAGRFHDILCEHKVTEVFMAHIHGYASEIIDGVRYTLTGGGGAPLSRRLEKTNRHYHLLNMRITPDGIERELCIYRDKQWSKRETHA